MPGVAGPLLLPPAPWQPAQLPPSIAGLAMPAANAPDVAQAKPKPEAENEVPSPEPPQVLQEPETGVGSVSVAQVKNRLPQSEIDPAWLDQQHRLAWQSIAQLWRNPQSAYAIASACDGKTGTGYACIREQGNWSRIRNLGLPVLLVLQGESPRMLLLQGITERVLLVGSGPDLLELAPRAVESNWLGEYIVVWPQAPDWQSLPHPG